MNDTRDWKSRGKANQIEDAQSEVMVSPVEFYIIITFFLKRSWRAISGQWSPCGTCLVHIGLFSSTHRKENKFLHFYKVVIFFYMGKYSPYIYYIQFYTRPWNALKYIF